MIRVYLDWNIFSYLKQYKNIKEPFISLNKTLIDNQENILIPYTSAHLTDLISSYNQSEESKQKTIVDLKYLEDLTENLCILHDYKSKKTYSDQFDITEYFNQLLESERFYSGNFDDLFSNFKGTELLIESFLEGLKKIPTGIDVTIFDKLPPNFGVLRNIFKGTKENDSYYHLLNDSFKIIAEYHNNPKIYKSIRTASLNDLGLSNDYSQSLNPLKDISSKIEMSNFKKTFKEFVEHVHKLYYKEKEPSRFDIFTTHYILLDFFGYYRDKKFKNLIQDSFHAYYAAHCDFFITDDDNTYHKAKLLYDHFKINTIVCKSEDFYRKYYTKAIINSDSEKSLLEIITDIINNDFVIPNQIDADSNLVDIYKINHYIFNYFNRLQITHAPNNVKNIYLYKHIGNYSSFYFFKEIEKITNRVSKEFGVDLNNRLEYNSQIEDKELIENKWKGRKWKKSNSDIALNMLEYPFALTLEMILITKFQE